VRHHFSPIVGDVFNTKLFGNYFRAFAMTARDSNDPCSHAIAKAWDLSGAGKPCPDNSDADRSLLHGPLFSHKEAQKAHKNKKNICVFLWADFRD
jgi:hypothetical protein